MDFGLAWDRIEVRQMNPLITTNYTPNVYIHLSTRKNFS